MQRSQGMPQIESFQRERGGDGVRRVQTRNRRRREKKGPSVFVSLSLCAFFSLCACFCTSHLLNVSERQPLLCGLFVAFIAQAGLSNHVS